MTKKKRFFDVDEILANEKIREVYVPEIDCYVRFGPMDYTDFVKVSRAQDLEKAAVMLYCMLHKADPTVTLEKVKKLPVHVVAAILAKINQELHLETTPFQPKIPSEVAG